MLYSGAGLQVGRFHFAVVTFFFVLCRVLWADPGVAIIMPLHNGADTVALSIGSVVNQSFKNWDLWVIDDASTDNSAELVERMARQDSRIHLHSLVSNVGAGKARNIGAAVGRRDHKYVAFIDDDDLWDPTKLEKQVEFMEKTGAAFTFTSYRRLSFDGLQVSKAPPIPDRLSYHELLTRCPIATTSVMLNAESVGIVNFPAVHLGEDLRYWLNLTKKGIEGRGIPEATVFVRRGGETISSNKLKMISVRWNILREVEGLSLPIASYYFLQYAFRSLVKYRLSYKLTQLCPPEIAAFATGLRASPFFLEPELTQLRSASGE